MNAPISELFLGKKRLEVNRGQFVRGACLHSCLTVIEPHQLREEVKGFERHSGIENRPSTHGVP